MKKTSFFLMYLIIIAMFSACQAATTPTAQPTATIPPTKTATSTATLWPTIAPVITITDIPPTSTAVPPERLTDLFSGVKVITLDDFETLSNWNLWNQESVTISEGVLALQGQPNWNSGLVFNKELQAGNGIVLTYKTAKNLDSMSEFVFVSGEYQTDIFRQFGVYNGKNPKADLYQGKNGLGFNNLHGNFSLHADTWYTLVMAISKNGEFIAVIYNPENPSQRFIYQETLGEKWADLDWEFRITANNDETIFVDDFMQFTFSAFE